MGKIIWVRLPVSGLAASTAQGQLSSNPALRLGRSMSQSCTSGSPALAMGSYGFPYGAFAAASSSQASQSYFHGELSLYRSRSDRLPIISQEVPSPPVTEPLSRRPVLPRSRRWPPASRPRVSTTPPCTPTLRAPATTARVRTPTCRPRRPPLWPRRRTASPPVQRSLPPRRTILPVQVPRPHISRSKVQVRRRTWEA